MGKSNRKKRNEEPFEPEKADIIEIDFKGNIEEEEEVAAQERLRPAPPSAEELAASKAWRLALSSEDLTTIMQRSTFGALKLVPWGSNYTFITALCDELTGAEYAVIYKPRR